MKKLLLGFIVFTMILSGTVNAHNDDEGMWLPLLIQKLNMNQMKKMGCKLTAEDIYSVNKSSLKDAVIALDHGSCTGELVSADGLFLTNHHCGYGEIQFHSSVEHDYLTNGFWAMTRKDELPNMTKTVSFLINVEDVTEKINAQLTAAMTEDERDNMIRKVAKELEDAAIKNTKSWYEAKVTPFFKGNQFFLFVYETYKDVRLVGAPPSSIGKFGADTDNWMWPRHTGDFSMFRIYCAPDGKPAEYSINNVPYHPKKFFPISLKGVEMNDFTMVMGYPGTTNRFMSSWAVKQTIDNENAIRIDLRGIKQEIMKKYMDESDEVRIQYSSKYSRSQNYYKYSIGQNNGLNALNVIGKKQELEARLAKWIAETPERKAKYGEALSLIETGVKGIDKYDIVSQYWFEGFYGGSEIMGMCFKTLRNMTDPKALQLESDTYFKDLDIKTDREIFIAMAEAYKKDINSEFHPDFFTIVKDNYQRDFKKYAKKLYETSIFTSKSRYEAFIKNPSREALESDMGYQFTMSAYTVYQEINTQNAEFTAKQSKGERLFVAALLEMDKDKAFAADANSTMRLTYGKVGDYSPKDAVNYKHYTTLDGYMQKEDPENEEFVVFPKLKELYKNKDYGQYGQKLANGTTEMRVCFTSNNDITGGNSGSPVINGNGELVGIAFDGNWEAMSGDIAYEPDLQKCINVDIRFVLFVIDKYAGAGHLVKEMTIIK